jgi:glucose repression regulatory protein TUP1
MFYLSGHTHDIYSLEWTKDGKFLVSGSGDGTVRVWDAENGQNLMTLSNSESENFNEASSPHERGVTSITLNPVYQRCVAAVRFYLGILSSRDV